MLLDAITDITNWAPDSPGGPGPSLCMSSGRWVFYWRASHFIKSPNPSQPPVICMRLSLGHTHPAACLKTHFLCVEVQEIVKCFPLLSQWTSSEIADSIQSKLVTREQFSRSVQRGELFCFALFLLEMIRCIFPRGKLRRTGSFVSPFVSISVIQ